LTKDYEDPQYDSFHLLGFHPYKEIIFLTKDLEAVAYHLNNSNVHFLGIYFLRCA
jgi:hypothetical protein